MAKLDVERARLNHLDYMRECWKSCLKLAEGLIGHKSADPADEDMRRMTVFEFSQHLFQKHAVDFAVFIELAAPTPRKKRRGAR